MRAGGREGRRAETGGWLNGWVPLFVRARGLVMERGGVLSHGAIVAREYGLPAVSGLPGVQHRLRTGQRLRIDGGRGTVTVLPG